MRTIVLVTAITLPALAAGHGAVTFPPCRQAIDKDVAPWNKPPKGDYDVNNQHLCVIPGADGQPSNRNAQACFW